MSFARKAWLASAVLYAVGAVFTPLWWLLRILGVSWLGDVVLAYACIAPMASPVIFDALTSSIRGFVATVASLPLAVLAVAMGLFLKRRAMLLIYAIASISILASCAVARLSLLSAFFSVAYVGYACYAALGLMRSSRSASRLACMHYVLFGALGEAALMLRYGVAVITSFNSIACLAANVVLAWIHAHP